MTTLVVEQPRPALFRSPVRTATPRTIYPVLVAGTLTGLLGLVWALWLSRGAGDLAAQYAWAAFVRRHPDSAYNMSWFGGMHPASYSVLSPYVMAWVGVRTTGVLAAVASAALGALLLARSGIRRPMLPVLWLSVAVWSNLAAGRVTYLLGAAFALAAAIVVQTAWSRWATVAASLLGLLAALCSPVAGLFVEVLAAALFLTGRRRPAVWLASAPPVVIAATSLIFPFSGEQPFPWHSALGTVAAAVAVAVLVPRAWRTVRAGSWVYAAGVVLCWVLPTPIGSNVERLALLAAAALLLCAAGARPRPGWRRTTSYLAAVVTAAWTLAAPVATIATAGAPIADARPLLDQLQRLGAQQGRVEVVPMKTHWEAAGIAPSFALARGWNRQADVERNPLFYDGTLTAASYYAWLRTWGVGYVVLPATEPDSAGVAEARLIGTRPSWLPLVWQDAGWQIYRVADPEPLASTPAVVSAMRPAALTIKMPRAGSTILRIAWSPWLTINGMDTRVCLAPHGAWTQLTTTVPGMFAVEASYTQGRGMPCPEAG
ncbi:MAG: MFS transporter [Actinoplanes sp.]